MKGKYSRLFNRDFLAGSILAVLGAAMQRLVFALNGGMPALLMRKPEMKWVPIRSGTILPFLGDIYVLRLPIYPIGDKYLVLRLSQGDILIYLGLFIAACSIINALVAGETGH